MSLKMLFYRALLWLPFAIFTLYLVSTYSVNFPSDDQWDGEVPFLQKLYSGRASFEDLIAQHVEHRVGVHRLAGFAVACFLNWDVRFHILLTFILTFISSLLITYYSLKTFLGNSKIQLTILSFSGALLFSPIQIEAWTNPMMPLPYLSAFLLLGLAIAFTTIPFIIKFLTCFVVCFISTFTFTTGILFWVLLVIPLFWEPYNQISHKKKIAFSIWIIGAIFSAIIYFNNFLTSPESPGIIPALENPLSVIVFFFTALGAPFAYGTSIDPVSQSFFIGIVLFIIFICMILNIILNINQFLETKAINRVAPWIFIGMWPIANIGISAVGRCSFGNELALSSRYATNSILLTISILFIYAFLCNYKKQTKKDDYPKNAKITEELHKKIIPLSERPLISLVSILMTLYICSIFWIFPHYGMMRSLKTNAKAALMFTKFFADRDLLGPIWRHESMEPLYPRVEFLEKMGFLSPKRVESLKISSFPISTPIRGQSQVGEFDGLAKIGENQYQLSGWALSDDGFRPADSVLITYEHPGQDPEVFALARVGFPRQEIVDKLQRESALRSGWAKQITLNQPLSKNTVLRAWALNTTSGHVTPIKGSATLNSQ